MKEQLLFENKDNQIYIYRVSKKLRKRNGYSKTTCIDIKIIGKKLQIIENKYANGHWTKSIKYTMSFGKTFIGRCGSSKYINYETFLFNLKRELSTYVSKKLNRIVNKHFNKKFKIKNHFVDNIVKSEAPEYDSMFSNKTYEMFSVYKKGIKKGLKNYCGFSGKKFIRDLIQLKESDQKSCVKAIKYFKEYLTHGEDLSKLRYKISDHQTKEYKLTVFENPKLAIEVCKSNEIDKYMLTDTIRMVLQLRERGIEDNYKKLTISKLEAYHDKLFTYFHNTSSNNALPYYPEIESEIIFGMNIKNPRTTNELKKWASYMQNCIASYEGEISNRRIVMCGLFDGDTLIYNASFRRNEILVEGVQNNYSVLRLEQLNTRFNGLKKDKDWTDKDLIIKEHLEKLCKDWSQKCLNIKMDKLQTPKEDLLALL